VLETDALAVRQRVRMEENDEYLRTIQGKWGSGIVRLVEEMPGLKFPPVPFQPGAVTT
jgi:predicted proteasome-type protease